MVTKPKVPPATCPFDGCEGSLKIVVIGWGEDSFQLWCDSNDDHWWDEEEL